MNYKSFIHILTVAVICVGSCAESSEKNGIVPIREEILTKTIPEQVEMFQALTPELRCDLWRVKMANTLASKNLTKEEKAVIKPLAALLTPKAYFDEDTSEGLALRKAAEEAAGRLTKEYAWDELKLFKYLETFMTEQEYDEYLRRINREDCQPK